MSIKAPSLLCLVLIACVSPIWASVSANNLNVGVYNGSVLIPVFINGEHLNFLFDTGSTRSTIEASVAERLKLEPGAATDALGNYGVQSLHTVRVNDSER